LASDSFKPPGTPLRSVQAVSEILSRAERFVWSTARVLEQRRFELLFKAGDPAAVIAALEPYRTADGGYGYALEPDGRGPTSQPPHIWTALQVLEEAGATDAAVCDQLASISAPGGGVPLALPSLEPYPRAPWWGIEPGGSLITTANILAPLLRARVGHPWVDAATAFCWDTVEAIGETHPYEAEAAVMFLDAAPDRPRAERAAERIGGLVHAQGLIGEDFAGYAPGEVHCPPDYAPGPDSLARRWFTEAQMELAVVALEHEQGEDGGWPVKWAIWTPATKIEWGGMVTLKALKVLRAYERI
jgi:hypothetical protein